MNSLFGIIDKSTLNGQACHGHNVFVKNSIFETEQFYNIAITNNNVYIIKFSIKLYINNFEIIRILYMDTGI